jgi:hypothetical protein
MFMGATIYDGLSRDLFHRYFYRKSIENFGIYFLNKLRNPIMTNSYIKPGLVLAIAGILGLFMPSPAQGEIPVTGGRTAGDAAFFVPNTGNTLLFDVNTRMIRLETPNGITVNSQFRPRGGRLNPMTGLPDGGETGFLEGTLSGRAFTAEGTPFFFQGIPTTLNFTLTSFDSNRVFEGTLMNPTGKTSTQLIFLEATGTSLSDEASQNFEAIGGELHIGEFSANLPNGSIDLPSDTQFSAPATEIISFDGNTLAANANTKFKLEGNGEGTTNLDGTEGTIRYQSENGTTNFTIQGTVEGIPDNSSSRRSNTTNSQNSNSESELIVDDNSFKVEGTIQGPINVFVGGVESSSLDGNQTYTGDTQYEINGIGRGSTEFNTEAGSLNFYSSESDTDVEITGDGFELQGNATGEVSLNVGVGLSTTGVVTGSGNGRVFGISPAPTSTNFGRGFQGLRPLPSNIETENNSLILDNQIILEDSSITETTTNNTNTTETQETPTSVLPSGPLPDSEPSEVTTPSETQPQPQPQVTTPSETQPQPQPQVTTPSETQPQPQPQVTTPSETQPQPQPQVTTPSETQPQPQPQVTTPSETQPQPQPQPQVTSPSEPQPQPQPEETNPLPEEVVRPDPLAELIEQIRQQRSQPDEDPSSPDFSEAVKLHLRPGSGPRSRVFPGMESLR